MFFNSSSVIHLQLKTFVAGTLMAMTNTVATIPGIVVPIFVGILTHGNVSELRIFNIEFTLQVVQLRAHRDLI